MIHRDTGGNPDGDTNGMIPTVINPDILPKINLIKTALKKKGNNGYCSTPVLEYP